jgi:hypothetical protein
MQLGSGGLGSSGQKSTVSSVHSLVIHPFLDPQTDSAGGFRLRETINSAGGFWWIDNKYRHHKKCSGRFDLFLFLQMSSPLLQCSLFLAGVQRREALGLLVGVQRREVRPRSGGGRRLVSPALQVVVVGFSLLVYKVARAYVRSPAFRS